MTDFARGAAMSRGAAVAPAAQGRQMVHSQSQQADGAGFKSGTPVQTGMRDLAGSGARHSSTWGKS